MEIFMTFFRLFILTLNGSEKTGSPKGFSSKPDIFINFIYTAYYKRDDLKSLSF